MSHLLAVLKALCGIFFVYEIACQEVDYSYSTPDPPPSVNDQLIYAATSNNTDDVRALLYIGAYANTANRFGTTPLIVAVEANNYPVVKVLLTRGAAIDQRNQANETALIVAASWGRYEIIQLLLDRSASMGARDDSGNTVLMRAVMNGHVDVAWSLFYRGADMLLEVRNNEGFTPLLMAAKLGYLAIVQLLVEKGANIEAKMANYPRDPWFTGKTAIMVAAREYEEDVVKYLHKKGASLAGCTEFLCTHV